jgi:fucose permease
MPQTGAAVAATEWQILLVILAAVALPRVAVSFGTNSIGVLAPLIQADLSLTRAQIGILATARFATSTLVAALAGIIVDQMGVRFGVLMGLGTFGAAMARVRG